MRARAVRRPGVRTRTSGRSARRAPAYHYGSNVQTWRGSPRRILPTRTRKLRSQERAVHPTGSVNGPTGVVCDLSHHPCSLTSPDPKREERRSVSFSFFITTESCPHHFQDKPSQEPSDNRPQVPTLIRTNPLTLSDYHLCPGGDISKPTNRDMLNSAPTS